MIHQMIKDKLDFKYMITIDPTYHSIIYKIPIKLLLSTYKHILIDWYDKKFHNKLHLHKDEQYIQLVCSHLYYIKNSKEREFLIKHKFFDELDDRYNPHLHILIDIPTGEVMDFFMFLKKRMRLEFNYSKCDIKKLGSSELDLIHSIKYGMKEETESYDHFDLQQKGLIK